MTSHCNKQVDWKRASQGAVKSQKYVNICKRAHRHILTGKSLSPWEDSNWSLGVLFFIYMCAPGWDGRKGGRMGYKNQSLLIHYLIYWGDVAPCGLYQQFRWVNLHMVCATRLLMKMGARAMVVGIPCLMHPAAHVFHPNATSYGRRWRRGGGAEPVSVIRREDLFRGTGEGYRWEIEVKVTLVAITDAVEFSFPSSPNFWLGKLHAVCNFNGKTTRLSTHSFWCKIYTVTSMNIIYFSKLIQKGEVQKIQFMIPYPAAPLPPPLEFSVCRQYHVLHLDM